MNTERARRLVLVLLAVLGLLVIVLDRGTAPVADVTTGAVHPATIRDVAAPAVVRRTAAPRRCYDLQPGERLHLEVDLDLHVALSQGDSAPQEMRGGIDGDLVLLVLARAGEQLALRAVMPDARIRGADAGTAAVQQLRSTLGQGTIVRLSQRGTILGYRFPEAMAAAQRNQFRTLFASLRATVGDADQLQWTVVEADATGTAAVTGKWDAQQLVLGVHKTAYQQGATALLPEVDGRGAATLDPIAAWWSHFDWQESSAVKVSEAGLAIQARATMRAILRAADAVPAAELGTFDWDAPWAPASGAGERDTTAVDPEHMALAAELHGVPFAAEFARLRELLAAGASDVELYQARRRLIWLLRNDARAVADLEVLLAAPGLPAQLVGEVLSAAGSADTAAVHAFLVARLAATEPAERRLLAMQALFQGASPAAPTVAAIRATFAEGNAPRELHGTGFLLLGALANRADGDAALQELIGKQSFARERGLVVDWLEALGNAGRPEIVDAALPSFGSTDVQERAAAVAAVRNTDSPRVRQVLADRAEHDDEWLVRARAVESLAGRDGSDLLPLFERIFDRDPHESVRAAALVGINARGDRAAAGRVLGRVAGQDPSPRLRELARELMAQR